MIKRCYFLNILLLKINDRRYYGRRMDSFMARLFYFIKNGQTYYNLQKVLISVYLTYIQWLVDLNIKRWVPFWRNMLIHIKNTLTLKYRKLVLLFGDNHLHLFAVRFCNFAFFYAKVLGLEFRIMLILMTLNNLGNVLLLG